MFLFLNNLSKLISLSKIFFAKSEENCEEICKNFLEFRKRFIKLGELWTRNAKKISEMLKIKMQKE